MTFTHIISKLRRGEEYFPTVDSQNLVICTPRSYTMIVSEYTLVVSRLIDEISAMVICGGYAGSITLADLWEYDFSTFIFALNIYSNEHTRG